MENQVMYEIRPEVLHKNVKYDDVLFDIEDAILNEEYTGFKEDYLVLHSLLRSYNPKTVLEIGTNMGTGTNIICNACPLADVYSLDLPKELAHISLQHPISEGKGDSVGHRCKRPYTQLRADSLKFDYESLPHMEVWFIDGEHDYKHPRHEAWTAKQLKAGLVIFHDSDMEPVWRAIEETFGRGSSYNLFRVQETRIAYAVKT